MRRYSWQESASAAPCVLLLLPSFEVLTRSSIKSPSDRPRLKKKEGYKNIPAVIVAALLLGLISLPNLVFHGTLGSEPSTGFMILAGSGMLGMVIRVRQRNIN
jgi:hypothetical protein